jgi:peroxiredoxin
LKNVQILLGDQQMLRRLQPILTVILLGTAAHWGPAQSGAQSSAQRNTGATNANEGMWSAAYSQVVPLEFALMDAYGREVRAGDYRGVPVLICTGACWCGGCQSEAEPLRLLAEKYRGRGLQVIRSVSYDGNLPAWEFQKHYRLPFVQLLDPTRQFESRYNRNGWPFVMLADSEGRVVFRQNRTDWQALTRLIESLLPGRSPVETVEREGISYMPATVKRSGETRKLRAIDRFPSVACAEDGRVYVAFTTNRGGTQDVFLRVFDGKKWLPDRPVAATDADEFDGTVVVDRENHPWVSWTSNAGGSSYNIYVTCAAESSAKKTPTQLTHCDPQDGAMHARMAVDAEGRIWAAYYRWERIHGVSRDKEVYTRYREQDRWSEEIHVNPEDILVFDDHTDPAIIPLGKGVLISWSWDFHRVPENRNYSQVPKEPTIFLRQVEPGPRFERARAVSGTNIDSRPTIAMDSEGRVLCAWESTVGYRQKTISTRVEDLQHEEQPETGVSATGVSMDICTPCLAASPQGNVSLVWAEPAPTGQWTLRQARWNGKRNVWTSPKTLVFKGEPRFPSAAYAKNGTLWIAYCADKGNRREVVVLKKVGDAR